MALPTTADLHVDQPLTNVSIGYTNQAYIADSVFPILPVKKQSDIIASYTQDYWFRDEAKLAVPGSDIAVSEYGIDTSTTYYCPRSRVGRLIYDEQRDNADAPFDLDADAARFVTDKLMMRRERQFVSTAFTSSVWTTDLTGGTHFTVWSNYAGSSPIGDTTTYKDTVESLIGREPNKFVVGYGLDFAGVYRNLPFIGVYNG